jgi:hypothetical protein
VKKKTAKKLALAKETLKMLDAPHLQDVLGRYGTMETQCCASWLPCSIGSACFPQEQ